MNIYIANLNYSITDADLGDLFSEYGEVASAKIVMDRETGRSRGFGFVEMPNDAEGEKAIEELNNAEYEGKVIAVSVARPRTERPNNFGGGNRGGGNRYGGGGGGNRYGGGNNYGGGNGYNSGGRY